jgi:hypothetical protein
MTCALPVTEAPQQAYLLTKMAAMIAEISEGALAVGALHGEQMSEGLFSPALKFWTAMDPALKAEAAAWTGVREELAKVGRRKVW